MGLILLMINPYNSKKFTYKFYKFDIQRTKNVYEKKNK